MIHLALLHSDPDTNAPSAVYWIRLIIKESILIIDSSPVYTFSVMTARSLHEKYLPTALPMNYNIPLRCPPYRGLVVR